MYLLNRSRMAWFMSVFCVVPFAHKAATAQEMLSITAHNDIPATVTIVVDAKDAGGINLFTTSLFWAGNDDSYTTQQVAIPSATRILRFTFIDDCCGPDCPGCAGVSCNSVGNPNCDRNAAVDSFTVFGNVRQGEDFDRVDSPPSCAAATVGGRDVVLCGQENQFAEYDLVLAPPVPSLSEWGLIVLTLLGLALGPIAFRRRRGAASA